MINALKKEIELRKDYLNNNPIETIYFGGGTPSILKESEISLLIKTISENYTVINNAEISLECNPDDLTREKVQNLKKSGINRLSIGIQSFNDEDLKFMNRSQKRIATSLDTRKSLIMEKGIKLGVKLINDISGLKFDNQSINVLKKSNKPFVIHHIQGNPSTMQKNPKYKNVLFDIYRLF